MSNFVSTTLGNSLTGIIFLALGISIGALLFMKIAIIRYFKHMEAKLAPLLGSALFLCSFLLIALVLPFSLCEVYLENTALGDESMVSHCLSDCRISDLTGDKDIRNGSRNNAFASTMSALVQNVTDEEITAIAIYLAAQK